MNKLKIYVWYTPNIIEYIELLEESCKDFNDLEIIHCAHTEEVEDKNLQMGDTCKPSYQDLMVKRWKILPDIIKNNIGNNIVWLDADCVFNKNNKNFNTTISSCLETNDFVFQYDNNSGLCENLNTGIMGIKCSDKTLKVVNSWYEDITTKIDRRDGYPLLEWNEIFTKHPEYKAKFTILPEDYCSGNGGWGIYHAIGISDKITSLKSKL
tara:strand:- start:8988 stop:9617 length:630 start_codon:yes stop_codon:yes gene_type:complete